MQISAILISLTLTSAALALDSHSAKPSPIGPRTEPVARPELVVPRGASLQVRLDRTIDTKHTHAGASFTAELVRPLVHDGATVLPKDTRFSGHVIESKPSGRLKGRAVLALTLDSLQWNGRSYRISTGTYAMASKGHKKRNLALIGGGSGVGATIGAIAGGGVGALAGAAAGGVAGTVGAAVTGKRNLHLPAESVVSFSLRNPVRL